MEFKDKIKELRISKNLSQQQLADKLGLSQSAVAKWELGKTEPTSSAIIAIANFFNETTDYILGLEDRLNFSAYQTKKRSRINTLIQKR